MRKARLIRDVKFSSAYFNPIDANDILKCKFKRKYNLDQWWNNDK